MCSPLLSSSSRSTRDPASSKAGAALSNVLAAGKLTAELKTDEQAANEADVVILAFPGPSTEKEAAALAMHVGGPRFRGTAIDLTNPFVRGSSSALEISPAFRSESAAEAIARALPHAMVFKALNSIGAAHYGKPPHHGKLALADGLIAGPGIDEGREAAAALACVFAVVSDVGLTPRWVGPLRYARNLESLAELWVGMAYATGANGGNADFAFSVVDARGAGQEQTGVVEALAAAEAGGAGGSSSSSSIRGHAKKAAPAAAAGEGSM
jgi:predicted dinucleotide-binding enzyme